MTWLLRIIKSKIVMLVLLALLICLLLVTARAFLQRYALQQQIDQLESEIATVESQSQQFSDLIEYLETQTFTEEEARLNLGLKKPGEEVVVVEGHDAAVISIDGAEEAVSNPVRWWRYFFVHEPAPAEDI